MKYTDHLNLLPSQSSGKEIEASAEIDFDTAAAAISFYGRARDRLLNVNNWKNIAGKLSAEFQLFDASGTELQRAAKAGDFLRINIPGPGNNAGDGFDWAQVENVEELNEEHLQCTGFRVRPSQNPTNDKEEIAHFYSEESTGNFIVGREHNKVYAWIIDRNTAPNKEADSVTDKLRDIAVGIGAVGVFS
ncbi:MAG: hypothetical protein EOP49_53800, partial [Sphingobacteriales bacterium]